MKNKLLSLRNLNPVITMTLIQIARKIMGVSTWTIGELVFFPFACIGVFAIIKEILDKKDGEP